MSVSVRQFAGDLWREMNDDRVLDGAASLAFYLFLSLFPAAIFLLSLLPYLPIANLEQAIMDFLNQVLPSQAATMFEGVVKAVVSQRQGGLLTFGLLFGLWSASSGIAAMMDQLNTTCDVEEARPYWKVRAIAIILLLLFMVLIVGAFALVVSGGIIQDFLASWVGRNTVLLTFFATLRWIIIAVFLLLGFAAIYYFGPDVERRFRFISPGSIVGTVLLVLVSGGFRLYISNFGNYNATYGSIGAIIILLLWLYVAGVVLLIGSEINTLVERYALEGKSRGEKREPSAA